ncbi:MAG: hypothetical protein WD002_03110 [Pseudomonadales bacterium]
MKLTKTGSNLIRAGLLGMLLISFGAAAELDIQNAQYKAQKEALYVKGKLKGTSANTVYVLDARSMRQVGTVEVKRNQFRADLAISATSVPCMVQIQTNPPRTNPRDPRARSVTTSDPGDFSVSKVRHAGDHCTN